MIGRGYYCCYHYFLFQELRLTLLLRFGGEDGIRDVKAFDGDANPADKMVSPDYTQTREDDRDGSVEALFVPLYWDRVWRRMMSDAVMTDRCCFLTTMVREEILQPPLIRA